MRLLTIVAVASSLAAEKPPLPPETLELAGLARSAPPEIAAAALLRLVESSRVPDREQQFEFIEEAFALAAQARSPYPLSAGRRAEPDTRAGYQLAASGLALDRLSLQTRAVQLLLSADPPRALELFRRIPRPSPPPAACGQVLFPLPGGYYLTMLGVLEKSYSAGQRKAGDDLRDRLSWAAALQSPTEFGFALQVFALSSQEEDHRSMGMIALIGRLRQMQTDWPTFTATAAQTIRDAGVLADRYAQSGGERAVVWDALRAYLLRHLAGPRCAGNEAEAGSILRQFNAKAAQNGVASIEADEVRASREIDEDSPPALYYATDETQAIARALRELRFDPQGRVWNEEVRRGVQWRRRFDESSRLDAALGRRRARLVPSESTHHAVAL
jgi:hypothetical protein